MTDKSELGLGLTPKGSHPERTHNNSNPRAISTLGDLMAPDWEPSGA